MGEKLRQMRSEKPTSVLKKAADGVKVYTGTAKKEEKKADTATTSKVDAAAIATKKAEDEKQYKENQEKAKKKKLTAIEIAMGKK